MKRRGYLVRDRAAQLASQQVEIRQLEADNAALRQQMTALTALEQGAQGTGVTAPAGPGSRPARWGARPAWAPCWPWRG
jgi:hypothetical protein